MMFGASVTVSEHRVSVDQTDIPADLDGMLTSLATEDAESLGAGDDGVGWVSGPCMEHLLRYNILETLYTLARTDVSMTHSTNTNRQQEVIIDLSYIKGILKAN